MVLPSRRTVIAAFFLLSAVIPPAMAGEIRGKITVEPPFPQREVIVFKKKSQDACEAERVSESLIVSQDGFLKNALVSVKGDFAGDFPQEKVVIDQKRCNFEPHIQVISSKSPFLVANSDPLAHDVRIFQGPQMLSRFEMDEEEKPVRQELPEPGIYLLRCGLHIWMHAFIVSARHPYHVVSDDHGNIVLKNVPAGKQTLRIWHETLGEDEIPVEVTDGVTEFSYQFKGLRKI